MDRIVVAEAATWGIPAIAARLLVISPPVAMVALALTVPHPQLYHFLVDEDHVIEWTQFFAILIASFAFIRAARQVGRMGGRWLMALFMLVGIGAFIVAGEEISWGQRLLGLATPDPLKAINHQGETNIHNISSLQRVFNLGEMLVGLYGFTLPLLWASRRVRDRVARAGVTIDRLLIPPICLATLFFLPFAYRAFRAILLPEAGERITELGELPELTLYLGILITGLVIVRATRTSPTASTPSTVG